MNDDAKNALISYRMERAAESVEAARLMLDNTMPTSAMNRIYYAMFYAVQAVLITKNASFSKHGQVKGYFSKEFVHKGLFSVQWGKYTIRHLNIGKNLIMSILRFRRLTWSMNFFNMPKILSER